MQAAERQITLVHEPIPREERILRACAYVRVSTNSEDQLHSFAAQRDYWKHKLSNNPKFKFVGVFADEGISGKSAKKRKQFMEMVEHAKRGKIDIIFVKSVSRFGRDLVDILYHVRDLRDNYKVVVYFEEEEMYSDDPLADTLLSMRAMVAEQELKDMSEQQKWAARRRYENGSVEMASKMLGYRVQKDGNGRLMRNAHGNLIMHIKEDEAETVRLIFSLYISGKSCQYVGEELERRGRLTVTGNRKWGTDGIRRILRNEKYIGNALLQKTYMEDFVPRKNNSDDPKVQMYYVENHHDPIIDRETFETAQREQARRANIKLVNKKVVKQPFAGMIRCGGCGVTFRHKVYQYRGRGLYGFWCCNAKMYHGLRACTNNNLKDDILRSLYIAAFNEFVGIRIEADSITAEQQEIKRLRDNDAELLSLMYKGYLNKIHYIAEHKAIIDRIAEIDKLMMAKSQDNLYKAYKKRLTEFDPSSIDKFLKSVTVSNWTVTFIFKNGVTIIKPYTNGTSGNKPGWNIKNKETVKNGAGN